MVRVVAPNGVIIEASDEAAPLLLANGYARAEATEQAEQKPKAAPARKRTARSKE